jgi:hypothetical protein
MATTFTNFAAAVTTSWADVYVVPEGKTAILIGLHASNNGGSSVGITIQGTIAGGTRTVTPGVSIPGNSSVGLLAGKMVLKAGETLSVNATTSGYISLIGSVTEIS